MKFTLFGRSPMEKSVTALRQRAATLGQKRDAAQGALDRAVAERQAFATTGDLDGGAATDAAMAKLQKAVDSASSSLSGLDAAIAEVTTNLTAAESALTAERDHVARVAASEKLSRDLAALETQIEEYLADGRALAANLENLGALVFESGALSNFVSRVCSELELGGAVARREIQGAIDRIRDGTAALPEDAKPPAVIEIAAPPPTMQVFMLRHSKYRDPETGALVLLHRFTDAELSPGLAERALRSSAAVPLSDPRRREWRGTWPRMNAPEHAFDLDAVDLSTLPSLDDIEASRAEVVEAKPPPPEYAEPPAARHSKFEPLDRGPSFVIRAPRQVLP